MIHRHGGPPRRGRRVLGRPSPTPVTRPCPAASRQRQRASGGVDGSRRAAHDRPMLRARVFGGLAVWVDDRRMPEIGGVKPRSLLAFLLLNPGPHPRSRLAGSFWPSVLDTSARGSLRSALWSIRAALDAVDGADHLKADRLGVGLDPALEREVDALEVRRLLDLGDPASLERALLLGSDPLLPDIPDEWVREEQDRQRDRMIDALGVLADAADAGGDAARALSFTREALVRDRLRESSHRALMRRLAAVGDRGGALAAYGRCRDTLAGELGVPPSAETRALAEEIRAGTTAAPGPASAPAPPAPARPRGPALAAMVGRDDEIARLRGAWAGARAGRGGIVLVEGAAGVGKSRLAAEMLATAERDGGRVALGHALDIEEGPPFGPWADALRQLVRGTPAPPAAAAWPEDLARLCPAVEAAWGRHPGPVATEPTLGAREPLRGRRRGPRLGVQHDARARRAGGRAPRRPLEPGAAGPSRAPAPDDERPAPRDPAQRGVRRRRGPHARRAGPPGRGDRRDPARGARPGGRRGPGAPRGPGPRPGRRRLDRRALGRQPPVRAAGRAGRRRRRRPRGGAAGHGAGAPRRGCPRRRASWSRPRPRRGGRSRCPRPPP